MKGLFAGVVVLTGCSLDVDETDPPDIERGLSKFLLRNSDARLASSSACKDGDPHLPTKPEECPGATDGIKKCLETETDESYRKILEARIELIDAECAHLKASAATTLAPANDAKPDPEKVTAEKVAKDNVAVKKEKLDLRVDDFKKLYTELSAKETVELNDKKERQAGYLTKTQASALLIPNLNMFQPAVIQSFSLRNIFQAFNPNSDPVDVRAQVESDLARLRFIEIAYGERKNRRKEKIDTSQLNSEQFDLAVDSVVEERLAGRWWHTRADLFSFDVGLTHPDLSIGEESRTFARRVDDRLPEFIFGGGIHFGALELSSGVVLYRTGQNLKDDATDEDRKSAASIGDFKLDFYIGFSLEIFQKNLRLN